MRVNVRGGSPRGPTGRRAASAAADPSHVDGSASTSGLSGTSPCARPACAMARDPRLASRRACGQPPGGRRCLALASTVAPAPSSSRISKGATCGRGGALESDHRERRSHQKICSSRPSLDHALAGILAGVIALRRLADNGRGMHLWRPAQGMRLAAAPADNPVSPENRCPHFSNREGPRRHGGAMQPLPWRVAARFSRPLRPAR